MLLQNGWVGSPHNRSVEVCDGYYSEQQYYYHRQLISLVNPLTVAASFGLLSRASPAAVDRILARLDVGGDVVGGVEGISEPINKGQPAV